MKQILVIVAVVLGLIAVAPGEAEAKKGGLLIYHTGADIFESGPLPEPYDKEPKLAGFKAGYMCDIWGAFWSYVSVKNCKPVAYAGDTYFDETELAAAIKAKYPSYKRGIWNRFGWMILLVVILGGIAYSVLKKDDGDSE